MTMQFWRSENFVIVYKENILVWNNFVKETFPKRYQLYIDKLYKIFSNIINIDLSNDHTPVTESAAKHCLHHRYSLQVKLHPR